MTKILNMHKENKVNRTTKNSCGTRWGEMTENVLQMYTKHISTYIYTQECAYMDRYICINFFSLPVSRITELWNHNYNYDKEENEI